MNQLTHIIAEKEKKSSSYKDGNLTSLSDEKRKKMKKFIMDYVKSVSTLSLMCHFMRLSIDAFQSC
jgi:hypothetical protein